MNTSATNAAPNAGAYSTAGSRSALGFDSGEGRRQPWRDDRICGDRVDPGMDHGKVELRIFGPRTLAAASDGHEQAPVDLLPPVHARGVLLPDEAAFGEAHAVQLGSVALEPEDVAKLCRAFGDAEPQPMREPALRRFARLREPSPAKVR